MEIVIPPRAHGPSTYKYEWDENGEVVSTRRVSEGSAEHSRRGRGRQTVQWPFQSIVITEASVSSPTLPHFPYRRATWQPRGLIRDDDDESVLSPIEVPDYVINYIRGETPESVARRKRNGGKKAERGVDLVEHNLRLHQHQLSHAGQLEDALREALREAHRSRALASSPSGSHNPVLSDKDEDGGDGRPRRRLTHGWRGGVALNALFAFLILVLGFGSLILAVSRSATLGGESTIYTGSCAAASRIDFALHAAIAVMVVVLVAGANYVFQVLSSPTRLEVAAAHERSRWMDIGIPSLRNLAYIPRGRVALAVLLLLAAVVTQVIYNSIIFTSQSGVEYNLLFVTRPFLTGAPFSNATANNAAGLSRIQILGLQELAVRNQLVNLTTAECLQEFSASLDATFQAALLVTDVVSPASSLLQTGVSQPATVAPTNFTSSGTVQYCLAQPNVALACTVSLNASLLGVVALLNLVTLICTTVALAHRFSPLVTLGDCMASFLQDPDPTTRSACLMTKADVWQGRWGLHEAKYWLPRNHYWFHSPSVPRWLLGSALWWALVGLAAAALGLSTHVSPDGRLAPFGQVPRPVYVLPDGTATMTASVLAALPQLMLAGLYLATNSLLSTFFLSHEATQFSLGRPQPLRVSASPEGAQTTSLFLTLPRPWSWCLLTLFAAMGFVLSQTVKAVAIKPSAGQTGDAVVIIGFSGTALLILLALLVVLAILVLALGFRRAPAAVLVNGEVVGNPLALAAGSCSAVLSARCHALPRDMALGVWRRPVAWGVVAQDEVAGVDHCSFSSRGVAQLDMARCYA